MLGVGGIFSSHLGRFSSCRGGKRGKEEEKGEKGKKKGRKKEEKGGKLEGKQCDGKSKFSYTDHRGYFQEFTHDERKLYTKKVKKVKKST